MSTQLAKHTLLVSSATLLSRILGFLRDLCLATLLGAGPGADAFFVAFRIPNLLRRLFAEGSLSMAFVPVFSQLKIKSKNKAFILARSLQLWIIIILSALVGLGFMASHTLIALIAPGFVQKPELFQLTVHLTQICLPYIIFISCVALYTGILNCFNYFFLPALAPCILNLSMIGAALFGYFLHLPVHYCLAYGVLLAGLLQVLSQWPGLTKIGFSLWGEVKLISPELKKILFLTLPTVFGAAIYQVNMLAITFMASFLAQGSISYLYYADRLVQFPLGVFGIAIGTAALPALSSLIAQNKILEAEKTLGMALNLNLFITLPASAGLLGLAQPIISLLFGHGAFTPNDVNQTALALAAYTLGLPAFALTKTLVSCFYALKNTKIPVIASCISMVVNIVAGFILMKYLQHVGLALAVSLSSWLNIGLLIYYLKKRLKIRLDFKENLMCISLSLLILISTKWSSRFNLLGLISIPAGIIGYLALSYALKLPSGLLLLSSVAKKKIGKTPTT